MDSISKLRGLTNFSYVQRNMIHGQGEESNRVFIFKMSEMGLQRGIDLIMRVHPRGDVKSS